MQVSYGKLKRSLRSLKNRLEKKVLKLSKRKVSLKHSCVNIVHNNPPLLPANAAVLVDATRKPRKRATDLVRRNRRCIRFVLHQRALREITNLQLVLKTIRKRKEGKKLTIYATTRNTITFARKLCPRRSWASCTGAQRDILWSWFLRAYNETVPEAWCGQNVAPLLSRVFEVVLHVQNIELPSKTTVLRILQESESIGKQH